MGFFLLNIFHSSGPAVTPYQQDTLLFYQYARGMAEGHPYCFTEGQQPSTGSTSHLYPAVLALCYLAGAQGEWLSAASFALGILCYTAVLTLACLIVRAIRPSATLPVLMLCGSSGHLVFSLLGESDIALFAPLALGAWAAALHRRYLALAVLLFLGALCRPEGMLLSGLLLAVSGMSFLRSKQSRTWARPLLIAAGVGLTGCAAVFLLNWTLTGEVGFQSVRHKGYFNIFTLPQALIASAKDLMTVVVQIIWGADDNSRMFYSVPLMGGALFFLGIFARRWTWDRRTSIELWFLVSIVAAMGLVATSGWAGFLLDRYFGWWMPVIYIYTGIGVVILCDVLMSHSPAGERRRMVLALTLLCAFLQSIGMVYFTGAFVSRNVYGATVTQFYRDIHAQLPVDARIGVLEGSSGAAYYMPGREVYQFAGFTSPHFQSRVHSYENIETLKHQADLRFDYWLTSHAATSNHVETFGHLLGPVVTEESSIASESGELALFHADWTLFPPAWGPRKPSVLDELNGWSLVDELDIGFGDHEISHDWNLRSTFNYFELEPCVVKASSGGQEMLEVGRVVLGTESFELTTQPGKPLRLVMRTIAEAHAGAATAQRLAKRQPFTMPNPLILNVHVDEEQVRTDPFAITTDTGQFDEIVINIPGDAIRNERTRITLGGNHISCGYWAYQ